MSNIAGSEHCKPVLYSYWRSSAAWRVRIALALKGIDYEYCAVNLVVGEQSSDEYKANVHAGGLVPALKLPSNGQCLVQSLAIIEYLNELYPHPALYPQDHLEKAHVSELVYTIACDTHPIQNLRILKTYPEADRPTHAKRVISSGLGTFEALLHKTGKHGRYCWGDSVTMADLVLVPQVYNAHRWGVDMSQFPLISGICENLSQLPAFKAAHADSQPDAQKA